VTACLDQQQEAEMAQAVLKILSASPADLLTAAEDDHVPNLAWRCLVNVGSGKLGLAKLPSDQAWDDGNGRGRACAEPLVSLRQDRVSITLIIHIM
jgi:hypothetical protein